jgi:predicted kinase
VKLVLLNGPPAIGKSTIAQRYVDDHPLALNLDVDGLRSALGQWSEHGDESGLLARSLALAMARTQLSAGYDVVVPQFLGRLPFIVALEDLAAEMSADFYELVLLDSKASSLRRFSRRTEERGRGPAEAMVERAGGEAVLEAHYESLLEVLAARPGAVTIEATWGEVDETYAAVLRCLTSSRTVPRT